MDSLYIADQRGRYEDHKQRIVSTLNYGDYFNEHKKSIGRLFLLNECSLAKNTSSSQVAYPHTAHLFIPLVTDLGFQTETDSIQVEIGELLCLNTTKGMTYQLKSAVRDRPASFIHIGITNPLQQQMPFTSAKYGLPLDSSKDQWITPIEASDGLPLQVSIGVFNPGPAFPCPFNPFCDHGFLYIIEGAFELEDKILYSCDGIHLVENRNVELEAMTPYAIALSLQF